MARWLYYFKQEWLFSTCWSVKINISISPFTALTQKKLGIYSSFDRYVGRHRRKSHFYFRITWLWVGNNRKRNDLRYLGICSYKFLSLKILVIIEILKFCAILITLILSSSNIEGILLSDFHVPCVTSYR